MDNLLNSQATESDTKPTVETTTQPATTQTTPETPVAGLTPESPAYNPNFKYKVLDKEQEFDEFLRPVVKDAETEKKIRELYEKAHGIDFVKQERQKARDEFGTYKTQTEPVLQAARTINELIKKKDHDRLFEGLGISDDDVMEYVQRKIAVRKLSPDQQAAYNKVRENERRVEALEAQTSTYEEQLAKVQSERRDFEVAQELSKPDVAQIAQAFDARYGKPGAFKEEVWARGKFHWLNSQKDISAAEAVQEVLKLIGSTGPTQVAQPEATQVAEQAQGSSAQQFKPVIPNIAGKGTSPVKRVPSSIEELRQYAKEL